MPQPRGAGEPRSLPVPRHRIGPVIQAMVLLGRRQGTAALAHRMADLIEALDRLWTDEGPRDEDAAWWAAHLLGGSLLRVPDARPYLGVLRVLAGRITRRSAATGGPASPGAYGEFGPWFWRRLRLPEEDRIDLLRRLVPADGVERTDGDERYLDAVARRLTLDATAVQPLLCRWFTDERPLLAGPGEPDPELRPTVAAAAQALLHARRALAVDDLTDALIATPHARAGELLAALAEDEPTVLCRAVERWARDEDRPARRSAAARYGGLLQERVTAEGDRSLLRSAALALLGRPEDAELHAAALTLLVRDPQTRGRHLPQALRLFAHGDPRLPVELLAEVFPAHPEPVLAALRARLARPGDGGGAVLRALAGLDTPALALHVAGLVREYIDAHPEDGTHAAEYVDLRLEHGPAARALLLPLVTGLLRDRPAPPPVRAALARVLAGAGSTASRPLRAELLEVLLEFEQVTGRDPDVLDALLQAAAGGAHRRPEIRTRALVHRTGMLLVRTPEGAARFDRRLVELARDVPGFAALVIRRPGHRLRRPPRLRHPGTVPHRRRGGPRLAARLPGGDRGRRPYGHLRPHPLPAASTSSPARRRTAQRLPRTSGSWAAAAPTASPARPPEQAWTRRHSHASPHPWASTSKPCTPEETAVSIAAEIIQHRWGGTGRPLGELTGRSTGTDEFLGRPEVITPETPADQRTRSRRNPMAKLIYSMITSLDGYAEAAEGGLGTGAEDPEVHTFVNDLFVPSARISTAGACTRRWSTGRPRTPSRTSRRTSTAPAIRGKAAEEGRVLH
ncbi:hypothetical protein SMICM304S_01599 [Streptomyces microflavus]